MIRSRFGRFLGGVAFFASLSVTGCTKDGPTQPPTPGVDVVAVSGDGQFAPSGQLLIDPLTVSVLRLDDGRPVEGVVVDWALVEGSGAQLSPGTSQSDSTGLATATLRLGTGLGHYRVEARLRDQPERFVEFEAWAVLPPQLTGLSAATADAGQVITLDGDNFSTIASHNVVLFSGVRGSVIAAEPTQLSVTVPACMPSRTVDVSVQLGGQASSALPLRVEAVGEALELDFGSDLTLVVEDDPSCVRLAAGNWLAVVQSVSAIGAARCDYRLTGLRQAPEIITSRLVCRRIDKFDSRIRCGSPFRLGSLRPYVSWGVAP